MRFTRPSSSTRSRALAFLLAAAALLAGGPGPAAARGDDVCPEPNDDQQAACYLGPNAEALGFISGADDVDAYRIEVLDFDVGVRVELAAPRPYTVELLSWNGDLLAGSTPTDDGSGVVQATARLPGAYFVRVRSPTGAFSDVEPYVIFRELAYSGLSIPQVLYSSEFREGQATGFVGTSEVAEHSEQDGRYTIAMLAGGTPAEPTVGWAAWGPPLADFTLTVDARIVRGTDAGFQVYVRRADGANSYVVTVDARAGRAILTTLQDDVPTTTGWVPSAAIDTRGGVNRCIVRAAGDEIRIWVNGASVIRVTDASIGGGRFGFGAIAWGAPPVVQFDNVLVTTPSGG